MNRLIPGKEPLPTAENAENAEEIRIFFSALSAFSAVKQPLVAPSPVNG